MNICTLNNKFSKLILEYIMLLIKSEQLHNKLEKLYFKAANSTSKFLKEQIIKINNALNLVLVELMNHQWLIEVVGL